jgi:Peptidase family M28.
MFVQDVFVLLDLLGAPDPVFYNYFPKTEKWFRRMMLAERNLGRLGQLVQYSLGKPDQFYFKQRSLRAGIEDDHIPFHLRGVFSLFCYYCINLYVVIFSITL